jgi:diacylglycerol kinase family enzyme
VPDPSAAPVPAYANSGSGTASRVLEVLQAEPRCQVHAMEVKAMVEAVAGEVAAGSPGVLVAGGDGTVAAAASAIAGSETVLGVVPAGTLNHFARDHGLPLDPAESLVIALNGAPTPIDGASVNGRFFLNTSAVGAYVVYVRLRERWEPLLGYYGASLVAVVAAFVRLRSFWVEVELEGEIRRYRTPLVFVGIGERMLRPPKLGSRREGGRKGLHLLIVKHTPRHRLLAMAFRAMTRGIRPWAREEEVDSLLVERFTVTLPRVRGRVAVDGEIIWMDAPLDYRLLPDALRVRLPG